MGFLELLEKVRVEGGELEFELLPIVFLFDLARPFFAKAVDFGGVFEFFELLEVFDDRFLQFVELKTEGSEFALFHGGNFLLEF